jgi:[ribosomal protein S5]-alanine N-acetyltransferase
MPRTYFLSSARLGFGHWTADDLPLALALWGDPEVRRFLGPPLAESEIGERLQREIGWMRAYSVQYWPIFLRASGEHVGCAGLRPYKPEEQILELGFHLRPPFWGQGLAEEAGRAVIAFAFDQLHPKALFAGHHPHNAASKRVLQKLGFRYMGDELYPPAGEIHPSYLLYPPAAREAG